MPAVAAVLCLAVLIGLLVQPGGIAALSADYRTAVGERRLVELSDGSRAWLNSDTALSVDMSGRQRALRLHRGEALFEVAHDPQRPFVVRAAEREVRALGTRFDVNLLGRHMHVEVSEGIVQVDGADAPPLRLIAGQQVSLGEEMPVATVQPLDPDDASAWRRGKLIFNQRPLGDVLAQIERYLPGRILITDDALRQHRISGVADLDDPAALLASLDRLQSVRISRLPWLVVVRPAPES
ncbi:FecR family protein [Stutzerimonas stutzeri]|uniref:FecR family protein n=1 Tax=Stutzerimonas stutzeri TaxID=316 RepID=UPI003013FA84